jgi:peptide/nickel transport system substrate-binding protein
MNFLRMMSRVLVRLAGVLGIAYACGVGAADPNKVLRLAQGDVDSLDPQQWGDYFSGWVGVAIFEGLYEWDYFASPARLSPNTAAALPKIGDEGRTWTIQLKPGIHFTGDLAFGGKARELTAQDYVYSFKRILDPNLRLGGSLLLTEALVGARAAVDAARKPGAKFDYDTPMEGLRAVDRYTLQLRLNQPNYPVIEQNLTVVLAVAREVVEAAGRDIGSHPVGTGPYRLREWKRGSRIILETNPHYRLLKFPESGDPAHAALVRSMEGKRLPQVGVVNISIIDEMQSRLLEFEQGHLDYVELQGEMANRLLANGQLKGEYASAGIQRYPLSQTYVRYTYFNLNDPVAGGLSNQHVSLRRAIALAFNVDDLIRVAYAGQAVPLAQIVPPRGTAHDPGLPRKMPYDPAMSQALLDRAGYDKRDSENYRLTPDGAPLTLTILTRPGTLWREWETLWKKNLAAVGLRAQFRELPAQDQFKEMEAGHFQMSIAGWGGSPLGYVTLAQLQGTQTPRVNKSRFSIGEYDQLYEQMLREPDVRRQTALSRQMWQLAQIYMPLIPHVAEVDNTFVQPWVSGFYPHDFPSYWKYLDIDLAKQQRGQTTMVRGPR